jgi:hypothetical protein
MFATNATDLPNRYLKFDGMIHYYKNGWFSNKWTPVYVKLWSDSTLEWFTSKGSSSPTGSVILATVIPYICLGSQVRKIPQKKPRMDVTWNRDLLMAVAMDNKASTVHWFYFETVANIQQWVTQITQTLPRINDPVYPPQTTTALQHDIHHQTHPPMNAETVLEKRQKALDDLFDNSIFNDFGFGRTFVHLSPDDTLYSSDDEIHIHSGDGVTVHDDGKVHVSQIGDTTSITLKTGNEHDDIIHGTNHAKVHHVGL